MEAVWSWSFISKIRSRISQASKNFRRTQVNLQSAETIISIHISAPYEEDPMSTARIDKNVRGGKAWRLT
jgi:hypothetical protein